MRKLAPQGIGVLLLVAAGILLSACGQKGPLYLPDADDKDKTEQTTK